MKNSYNAVITHANIKYENNAIFILIYFKTSCFEQGINLCSYSSKKKKKDWTGKWILNILNVLNVKSFGDLEHTPCRIVSDHEAIYSVGNFLTENWVTFSGE